MSWSQWFCPKNVPREPANGERKCNECKVCNGENLRKNAKVLIDKDPGLDSQAEGCGFESRRPLQISSYAIRHSVIRSWYRLEYLVTQRQQRNPGLLSVFAPWRDKLHHYQRHSLALTILLDSATVRALRKAEFSSSFASLHTRRNPTRKQVHI